MKRIAIHSDVDGTILKQYDEDFTDMLKRTPEILPGVRDQFNKWSKNDYLIILTTARPESSRQRTEEQLREVGLFWHYLIMNYPNAPRYLINDLHPSNLQEPRAIAINLHRNKGMEELDLEYASMQQASTIRY